MIQHKQKKKSKAVALNQEKFACRGGGWNQKEQKALNFHVSCKKRSENFFMYFCHVFVGTKC